MADQVEVALTGAVLPGFEEDVVVAALARLLKIHETKAAGLLQGRETVVKRGVPAQEAPRYLEALSKAGVEAKIRAAAAASEPAALPVVAAPPPAVAAGIPKPAPLAPREEKAPPAAAPAADAMVCPACGTSQPKRNLCRACGADMARILAAKETTQNEPWVQSAYRSPSQQLADRVDQEASEPWTPPVLGFSAKGRVGRVRYLAYGAAATLPMYGSLAFAFRTGFSGLALLLVVVTVFAAVWLSFRTMALRLHDLNLSGKWVFAFFLPGLLVATGSPLLGMAAAGFIVLASLGLMFWPGTDDQNAYGSPAEPNTVWTWIGALAMLGASAFGGMAGPGYVPMAHHGAAVAQGEGQEDVAQRQKAFEQEIQKLLQEQQARRAHGR